MQQPRRKRGRCPDRPFVEAKGAALTVHLPSCHQLPLSRHCGPERSLQESGDWWPFLPTNVIECRPDAVEALRKLHGNDTVVPQDITKMDPGDYALSEGIVARHPVSPSA